MRLNKSNNVSHRLTAILHVRRNASQLCLASLMLALMRPSVLYPVVKQEALVMRKGVYAPVVS